MRVLNMSVAIPVVNAGLLYVNGLQMSYTSATAIALATGQARDSTNVNDITLSSTAAISTAVTGAGGLDQGAIAASVFYYVFVIGSSLEAASTAGMISLSSTAPALPSNYDMFRRVGTILTDGSKNILKFYTYGSGQGKQFFYDVAIATDITSGSSATYADVNITASIPAIATLANLNVVFTPTGAGNELQLIPKGSSATNGYVIVSGDVASVAHAATVTCPTNATPSIQYKVTGSATAINVQGYVDYL